MGRFATDFLEYPLIREDIGPTIEAKAERTDVFGIEAYLLENDVIVEWGYSDHLHDKTTVTSLLQRLSSEFEAFPSHIDRVHVFSLK